MTKVVLGIDIGGTNTVFGLIDNTGTIHYSEQIPTHGDQPPTDIVDRLSEKVHSILNNKMEFELTGIGVGAPNGNHFTGMIQDPPNLSWGNLDINSLLAETFSCHVKLTNDANAAAMGEKRFGIAKEMNDFVVITLGTGLGSGIFSGGKIMYGHDGMAGEMGHLSLDPEGRKCTCGLRGCLEMYASANGMRKTVQEFQNANPDDEFLSSLDNGNIDGRVIDRAVDEGIESAKALYEYTGDKLAMGLSLAATILSPEAFIFYGGYSQAGDRLLNPARKALDSYLMENLKGKVKILQSGLPHGQAGILGAASLIWT